ncbi:MAG: chitobiase/beta-hexosaminidase C-terminal domain-containing protein, partial [Methanobacterium sp.]
MWEKFHHNFVKKFILCLIFSVVILVCLGASFAAEESSANVNDNDVSDISLSQDQSSVNNEIHTYIAIEPLPPVITNPNGGLFNKTQNVVLTAQDEDSNPKIYYTINGSDPTNSSTEYTVPIIIGEGTTVLKFMAVDADGNPSQIFNETYIIDMIAPTANATPEGGLFNKTHSVALMASDNMDAAPVIYYTLDGNDPTTQSALYTSPVNISTEGTTILKFMAVDEAGNPSSIFNETYNIQSTANATLIKIAASTVKSYIETYFKLPASVQIGFIDVNMSQFLELLMTATLQINNGNYSSITFKNFTAPANPLDDIIAGNILKSEYLKIANDLKNYMDTTEKTPDYQYQTSIGTHLGFQNLVYMYSKVLNFYNSAKYLPNFAEMKPWSSIASQSAGIIANGPTFTLNQIKDAATTIKNYVET